MTEQELKEKIVNILTSTEFETYNRSENVVNVKKRTTYSPHASSIDYLITLLPNFAKKTCRRFDRGGDWRCERGRVREKSLRGCFKSI